MRALAKTALPSLLLLLLLGGCAGGPAKVTSVDAAAIKLAVDGVIKAFGAAVAARDTAAIAGFYTDDAVVLPANMPRVDGQQAIRRWWAGGLGAPDLRLVLAPVNTTVAEAGDLAIVIGTYDYSARGADGAVRREVGKFLRVLEPVGDRWKIDADIWNSDQPAPPAK